MSDFADVERFAREHARCGGLTPSAQSRPGGGYQLTITCACGAVHERWVTAEEASRPLPRAPASRAPLTPAAVPSWPSARPAPPRPPRIEMAARPVRGAGRAWIVWLILAAVLGAGAGVGAYLAGPDVLGDLGVTPRAAVPTGPPPAARAPLVDIARALRELQGGIAPGASLTEYTGRVASTRAEVERRLSTAPEPARAQVREVLEIHRLAAAAWRARTLDDRDEWAKVGQDPAVDLCPAVRRVVDAAGPPAVRASARGAAVAAALLQLWDCADERLSTLDRLAAGG
jgi:hypothetical protein